MFLPSCIFVIREPLWLGHPVCEGVLSELEADANLQDPEKLGSWKVGEYM